MKELDTLGVMLCSYQADIFSSSLTKTQCSSKVFLRRFFYSEFAFYLDEVEKKVYSFDIDECFASLKEEYGDSTYGKEKLPEPVLHYIGYLTRYICYTREVNSMLLFRTFKIDDFIKNYEVWHTQSEEYAVKELLNIYNLDESYFDLECRLKTFLRKQY